MKKQKKLRITTEPCGTCSGRGILWNEFECDDCGGDGEVSAKRYVNQVKSYPYEGLFCHLDGYNFV